jgi:hypothetical protein
MQKSVNRLAYSLLWTATISKCRVHIISPLLNKYSEMSAEHPSR